MFFDFPVFWNFGKINIFEKITNALGPSPATHPPVGLRRPEAGSPNNQMFFLCFLRDLRRCFGVLCFICSGKFPTMKTVFWLHRCVRIACATFLMDDCVLCSFVVFLMFFFHTDPWNRLFFDFGIILGGFGSHVGSMLASFWFKTSNKKGIKQRCSKKSCG